MLFTSLEFLFIFLPTTIVGYYLLPRALRNTWLLLASLAFYAWGEPKFVLKLKGAGLWGGIGGYLALDKDLNTIYGANFNHESETPGLGALIVELPFRQQFEGKHIRNAEGEIVSVAVLKAGTTAEGQEQVDALSGATITSTGVSDMLRTNLGEYAEFLNQEVKHCCGHCKKHGEGECCHHHGEGQCQHHAEEATEAQIGE